MTKKNGAGRPAWLENRIRVSMNIEAHVWNELKDLASKNNMSTGELVRMYVRDGLDKEKKKNVQN